MKLVIRSDMEQAKRDYQMCFGSPAGQKVLEDLSPFCRENETCVVPGDRDMTQVLEGRREVILRINQYLDLSVEELLEARGAQPVRIINDGADER